MSDWETYSGRHIRKRKKAIDATHRRRARLRGSVSEKVDRNEIIRRDASTCYLCGVVLLRHEVTLDHVIPIAKGGPHISSNLRVACRSCNARKGAR